MTKKPKKKRKHHEPHGRRRTPARETLGLRAMPSEDSRESGPHAYFDVDVRETAQAEAEAAEHAFGVAVHSEGASGSREPKA
jgi:hypothetical protein